MADEPHRIELVFDASDEYRPEPPPPPEIPSWKDGSVRIGIHTSIAGDITGALEIAHDLGANTLQIFSSSPRMWMHGPSRISEADAQRFRERRKELGLGPLVIHGNYLINLASANPVLRTRSVQAFHQELLRALALGADYLVAHPGCRGDGRGPDEAIAAISQGVKQAARGVKLGELRILIENTAGQGTSIGSKFEELAAILGYCRELPMGACLDTAHLFASGWDIRTAEGLDAALQAFDHSVGIDHLFVVHANDSKTALGSRADRHEHIGKGKIGLEAFGRILNHTLLAGRAFIAETPIDKPGDDRKNVAVLWKLVGREVAAAGRDGMKPRKKKSAGEAKQEKSAKRSKRARSSKRQASKQ